MLPIPARTAATLIAMAVVLSAVHLVLKAERQKGIAICQAEHDKALRLANDRARAEEFSRRARQVEVDRETHELAQRGRRDALAADAAGERLRRAVAATCRSGAVPGNPAPGAAGQAASDAERVRSDVLREVGNRLRALARIADERGAAGLGAQRKYEALTDGKE